MHAPSYTVGAATSSTIAASWASNSTNMRGDAWVWCQVLGRAKRWARSDGVTDKAADGTQKAKVLQGCCDSSMGPIGHR